MISVFHIQCKEPGERDEDYLDIITGDTVKAAAVWRNTPYKFARVADVQTDGLEEAFVLTNSIIAPWFENKNVTVFTKTRSTSVGDVLFNNGRAFVVSMFGFNEI